MRMSKICHFAGFKIIANMQGGNMKKKAGIRSLMTFLIILVFLPAEGRTATVTVDCTAATLQAAVNKAASGTVINVTGTCNENVSVSQSKNLITINGGGTAIINGVDAGKPALNIRGRGVVIKKLNITGGYDGISVTRGGTATIDTNTIENAAHNGISVGQVSHADIVGNIIRNNVNTGIMVNDSASAHIGFITFQDTTAKANTVQKNGHNGIGVFRSSSAVIVGNKILGNTNNGIVVKSASNASISKNLINSNTADGIHVEENSGANLGNFTGTTIFDLPNSTTVNNGNYGGSCVFGGYVNGRFGSLNGASGSATSDPSCLANLQP
jgi:parallel beta-helix repeat protein